MATPTIITYSSALTLETFISENKDNALQLDGIFNVSTYCDSHYNSSIPNISTNVGGTGIYGSVFFCDNNYAGSLSGIYVRDNDEVTIGSTIYVLTPIKSSKMSDSLGSTPSGCFSHNENNWYEGSICTSTIQDSSSYYSSTNDGNVVNIANLYAPYTLNDTYKVLYYLSETSDTDGKTCPYYLNLTLNSFDSKITPWTTVMEGKIYIPFLVHRYKVGDTIISTNLNSTLKTPDGTTVSDSDYSIGTFYELESVNLGSSIEMCLYYVAFNQAVYKLAYGTNIPKVTYSVNTEDPASSYSDAINLPASDPDSDTNTSINLAMYGYINRSDWASTNSSESSLNQNILKFRLRLGSGPISGITAEISNGDGKTITLNRAPAGYYSYSNTNTTGVESGIRVKYSKNTTSESISGFNTTNIYGQYYIPALSTLSSTIQSYYEDAIDTSERSLQIGQIHTNDDPLTFTILGAGESINFGSNSYSISNWNGFKTTISTGSTNITTSVDNWIIMISKIYDNSNTYIDIYGSTPYISTNSTLVKTLYSGMTIDCSYNGNSIVSNNISGTDSAPLKGAYISNSVNTATTYTISIGLPQSYSVWTNNGNLKIELTAFKADNVNSLPSSTEIKDTCTISLNYVATDNTKDYEDWYLSSSVNPWEISDASTTAKFNPADWSMSALSPSGGTTSSLTWHSSYPFKFTKIPSSCSVRVNNNITYTSTTVDPGTGTFKFTLPAKTNADYYEFSIQAYEADESTQIIGKTFSFKIYYDTPFLTLSYNGTSSAYPASQFSNEGGKAEINISTNCNYKLSLWKDGVTNVTSSMSERFLINNTSISSSTTYSYSSATITFNVPKNTSTSTGVEYTIKAIAVDNSTEDSITISQGKTEKNTTFDVSIILPDQTTKYTQISNGSSYIISSNEKILKTGIIKNTGNIDNKFKLSVDSNNTSDNIYFGSVGTVEKTISAGGSASFTYVCAKNDSTDGRNIIFTITPNEGNDLRYTIQQGGGSRSVGTTKKSGSETTSFLESPSFYEFTIQNLGSVSAKYKIYSSNEYCKISTSNITKSNTIFLNSEIPGIAPDGTISSSESIYLHFDKNNSTSNRECYITVEDTLSASSANKRFLVTQCGWPEPTVSLTCKNTGGTLISTGSTIEDAIKYTFDSSGNATGYINTNSKLLNFYLTWPDDLTDSDSTLITKVINEIGADVTIDYNTIASITTKLNTSYTGFSVTNNTNSTQDNIPIYITVKSYYKNIRGSFTPTSPYTQTFIYYVKANAPVSIGGEYSGNYLRNIDGIGNCYVFGPGYGAPGYGIRDFTVYDANNGKCKWETLLSAADQEKINAYLTPNSNTVTSSAYINALDKFEDNKSATLSIKATNLTTNNTNQKSVKFYKYPKPSLTGVFESNSKSTIDLSASDFKSDDTYNEYLDRYFYVDYNQNIVSQYEIQGDENIVVNKVYDDSNHIDTDTRRWYKVRISKNVNTNKALVSTIRFSYNYNDSIPDHTDDLTFDFIITVNPAPDPVVKVNKTLYNYEYYAGYQEGRYNLAESVTIDTTSNYLPVKWEFSDEELGTSGNEFNVTADGNILNVTIPVNTSTQNNKICKVALKYYYMGTTDHSYDKTEYLTFTVNKAEAPTFEVTGWKNELSYNFNSSLDDASVKIGINTSNTNHLPVSWSYDITERGTSGHEFDFFKQSDSVGYLTIPDNPNKISKSCTVLFSYKYTGNTSETFTSSYTCKVNSASPISFIVNAKSQDSNGNDVSVMSLDNSVEYYFGKNNSIAISVNTSNNSLPISWNYVKEESGTNGNEFIVQKDANNSSAGITILNVAVPTNTSIISYKSCLITFNYKYADAEAAGDSETVLFRINVGKATKPVISIYPAEVSWPGNHSTGDVQDITVSIANAELETVWEYEAIESGTDGNEFTLIKNESDNKLRISSIPLNASPEVDKKCNIKFKCYYAGSTDHVNDNTAAGVYTVKYVIGSQLSYDRNELVTQESIQCSQDGSTYTLSVYGMIDTTGERATPAYIQIGSEYITYGSKNIGKFKQTTVYPSSGMTADTYNQFDIEFEMYDSVELNDVTDVIYIKPYDANGNVGNTCTLSITQSAKNIYKPTVTTSKVSATGNISGNDYNLGFSTYVTSNYSHSNNDNIITYTDYCKILDYGIMIKQQDRNVWTTLWNSTYKDNLIYTEQLRTSTKTTIYYSMSLPYTNSILKISPDKTYEYKAVAKATYRDGKSNESEWVTETVSGSVNTFMIHGYKEEDLEYIRPYFKPVEKVNGYTTGVEIKNFLNSKAISFNRKKAKTIDISNWYSNYSISGNTLFLDINNALIDLVLHTPAFNKAWDYIKDDNLTDFKKLYIKKNIIPNIIINDKCIVELYCDETSSALGLTSEYNENMVKIKNFKNSLIRSAESDTYKMSITLDKNKQYYVVLRLNF